MLLFYFLPLSAVFPRRAVLLHHSLPIHFDFFSCSPILSCTFFFPFLSRIE